MVESNFSDARSAGYDPQAWLKLKDAALARPLRNRAAAYECARRAAGSARAHAPRARHREPAPLVSPAPANPLAAAFCRAAGRSGPCWARCATPTRASSRPPSSPACSSTMSAG